MTVGFLRVKSSFRARRNKSIRQNLIAKEDLTRSCLKTMQFKFKCLERRRKLAKKYSEI